MSTTKQRSYTRETTIDVWPFNEPRSASTETTIIEQPTIGLTPIQAMIQELNDYHTGRIRLENVTRLASVITPNAVEIQIWQQIITKPATDGQPAQGVRQYTTVTFKENQS